MKIKFSRTLAIACVFCMAFATLTAFADVSVKTITTYDYEEAQKATDDNPHNVTVTTTITGLEDNGEVTYYVENGGKIVYIDQVTAANKAASFTFVADADDVITATAKNGSDKGYGFQNFTFADGANLLTFGTPNVTIVEDNWGKLDATYGTDAYIFQGVISGTGADYGVKIGEKFFTAKGCDEEGNFAVVITGITDAEANSAVAYPVVPVATAE